ncbi:hypothetical protein GCM10019016_016960 [Streptomyces prasinosporus]|uniref:Uncharacterized protein n=1 Tax=Streptomyces prasinosporus TaxID=68256 RepID=A0ABP6TJD0_9ACTN
MLARPAGAKDVGVLPRDVQQGFMTAPQYEIGIAPAAVNGSFGEGTQRALKGVGSGRLTGNLGFPLPVNWSFHQIREFEFEPGRGLDHNVWRDGGDPGVSALTTSARSGTRNRR